MKKTQKRIIDALEFRRDQYNLTKREMAETLGIGYTHYIEIMKGTRELSLNGRINAARIGVPPKTLLEVQDIKEIIKERSLKESIV